MRELFGRIADLDPAASDGLVVIEYFDRLVAAHITLDGLVKEAAILARATVGYEHGPRYYRRLPSGDVSAAARPAHALSATTSTGAVVWLAPSPATPPIAQMVLERLTLATELTESRRGREHKPSAVEILLTPPLPDEPLGLRAGALGRLRLETDGVFRALALPLSITPPVASPHALIETPWGPIRGAIVRDSYRLNGRSGMGTRATGRSLHTSWRHALIALRLAEDEQPLSADDIGPILLHALEELQTQNASAAEEIDKVERARAGHWSIPQLRALANGQSLRAIAASAGLHHSTVHARLSTLPDLLGYDPQTPLGRVRLGATLMLWQLNGPSPYGRPHQ